MQWKQGRQRLTWCRWHLMVETGNEHLINKYDYCKCPKGNKQNTEIEPWNRGWNCEQLKGKKRGPGAGMSQITWPWKAGKEFVFYSKIRGVTFDLSRSKRYHDLICILNVHFRNCIKGVWGPTLGWGPWRHLSPRIWISLRSSRPHILWSTQRRNSRSSWGIHFLLKLIYAFQFKGIPYYLEHFPQIYNF